MVAASVVTALAVAPDRPVVMVHAVITAVTARLVARIQTIFVVQIQVLIAANPVNLVAKGHVVIQTCVLIVTASPASVNQSAILIAKSVMTATA